MNTQLLKNLRKDLKPIANLPVLILVTGFLLATTPTVATKSTTLTLPAGTTFSASSSYAGAGPAMAFDGNPATLWNAGAHPIHWIEVDFGSPQELSGIHALVSQSPAGNTVHQVSLDGILAFTWSGNTSDYQWLDHAFAAPQTARRVRITTTSSPSWVAWFEIQILGC